MAITRGLIFPAAALASALLIAGRVNAAPPQTSRMAIPNAPAQAKAEKVVRDVYGNYASEPPSKRGDIAGKMIDQAGATNDDPDERYVLLRDAADLAAGSGDAGLAIRATEMLARYYAIDVGEMKVDVLRKAAFVANSTVALEAVVDQGLNSVNDAAGAGEYDLALRLITPTEQAARGTHDLPLIQAVGARASELRWMQQESSKSHAAQQRLATNPNDPDANLTVGRFLCLVKADWKNGLPRLVKCGNPAFRAAAVADLAIPTHFDKQILVGDLWWDLGEKDVNGPQIFLRQRAAYWYSRALSDSSFEGLNRARVQKRVAAVPQSSQSSPASSTDTPESVPDAAPVTAPVTPPVAPKKPPVERPGPSISPPAVKNTPTNPVPPANPKPPVPPPPATRPVPAPTSADDPPLAPGESIFSDRPQKK